MLHSSPLSYCHLLNFSFTSAWFPIVKQETSTYQSSSGTYLPPCPLHRYYQCPQIAQLSLDLNLLPFDFLLTTNTVTALVKVSNFLHFKTNALKSLPYLTLLQSLRISCINQLCIYYSVIHERGTRGSMYTVTT